MISRNTRPIFRHFTTLKHYTCKLPQSIQSLSCHGCEIFPDNSDPKFYYTPEQLANCGKQPRIADLVVNKTQRGEFFYAIELTTLVKPLPTCVDFNKFLPVLPTYVGIAWLSYKITKPLEQVNTVPFVRDLASHIPTMPHMNISDKTKEHLDEFFNLNFDNFLAIRGDETYENQAYHSTHQLVKHARRMKGDDISIAVAGHPEIYANQLDLESPIIAKDLESLTKKIDCGADFIITQFCYTADPILNFLRKVRETGIQVPIMLGVVVPKSYDFYKLHEWVTNLRLPDEMYAEMKKFHKDDEKVKNFFVQHALNLIQTVLDADLGISGIHLYSMNNFEAVLEVLSELRSRGILKEPQSDCENLVEN